MNFSGIINSANYVGTIAPFWVKEGGGEKRSIPNGKMKGRETRNIKGKWRYYQIDRTVKIEQKWPSDESGNTVFSWASKMICEAAYAAI